MRIPGMLLWKLNLTSADVEVASAITTFFSWLVLAFPRGTPPGSAAPVFVTVAISDDPGSGSCSATVLLVMWGSLAMARYTACWASPAGLEAMQVKEPDAQRSSDLTNDWLYQHVSLIWTKTRHRLTLTSNRTQWLLEKRL